MDTSITTILMMVFSICIATVITIVFSYYLLKRRDRIKERKIVIQEFILPSLNEVLYYIKMKTDYRDQHGIEFTTISSDEIIMRLKGKVSYGNARLINAFYRYYNAIPHYDRNSEAKNLATFEVFYHYLDYAYHNIEKSLYKDDELLDVILKKQKIYGIAFVLTTILGEEEALNIISHKWLWKPDFLNKISVSLLEDLINNYNNATTEEHKLIYFLSTLKTDFVESPEIDRYHNLKEYLEEAIDIVKNRWVHYSN